MKHIFTLLIICITIVLGGLGLKAQTGCPGDPTVIIRTYEVTDASGNKATCEHRITVIDDTPPEIYCPSNLIAICNISEQAAYANYAAFEAAGGSTNDNCGIDETSFMLLSETSDNGICPETITRVYQIADQCGNTSTCTQRIVVNNTTSPSVVCPSDYMVDCFADISVDISDATFTSTCPNPTTAVTGPTLIGGKANCPGALYEIEYSITDNCGVTETCSQFVAINANMMTISCPADANLACGDALPAPDVSAVAVNMNLCSSENPVTVGFVSDASNGATNCGSDFEVVYRTYKATDACGNTAFCTQTFTYAADVNPPTITGCPASQTITPTADVCYGIVPDMLADVVATDDCTATADLTITQSPAAGTLFGFADGDTQTVTFTVTDACGQATTCTATLTYDAVTVPTITGVLATNETDCDAGDGTITVTGNNADEFSIDGGLTWQATGNFSGLSAGTYVVIVRNNDGTCNAVSATQEATITAPNAPIITDAVGTNPTDCGTSDGSITITASGGTAPLQYAINGGTAQAGNVFSGLAGGTYTITVTNANGSCLTTFSSVILEDKTAPTVSSVVATNITDCGETDGTITIAANSTAGNALEYSIDNGVTFQTGNLFVGLSAGNYDIIVRNADGTCEQTATESITDLTPPTITTVTPTNPSECGAGDGSIAITASGVSGTLEYSINNGATWQAGNTFNSLVAGEYNIVVRYNDGTCAVQHTTQIMLDDGCIVCPALNTIHADQEDVCSAESVNFVVSVDANLSGETLNYIVVNPGASIDPYTYVTGANDISGTGVAVGTILSFSETMPANTGCEMNSVQIYAYLSTDAIANLGLSADCKPFVATTVNIWPDMSAVTIQVTEENCIATFQALCNGVASDFTVSPSSYVIPEGTDPAAGTPTLTISGGVGSDCPAVTNTTVDLSACEPECPEIFDIQLDEESVCEATGTDVTISVEPNLVGVPLTIAYGNANEGVVSTVYSTPPTNILNNNFTVSAVTGVGTFTIPAMPANATCTPDSYVVYVYVSNPSTAGTNESSLANNCQPLAYTNIIVWPNPNDMIITATTVGCTTFFEVDDCVGYEVDPEFYVANEGDGATSQNVTILAPSNSVCPTSNATSMAIPECVPSCPTINDIQLNAETICEGTATTVNITTSGMAGEALTVAYGNANEALISDVYTTTPNTVISSAVTATNGTVSVSTGALPANNTCDPINYIVYAYLSDPNTAGANNSALEPSCRPVVWTNVTVWPDVAGMTPTVILTEDCVSFFGVLECPEYEVKPEIYAANEGDGATNVAVQVLADPASPCSNAIATNLAVPACASSCPDITTIQLAATSFCEDDVTDILITTDASLAGNNLTVAYGNVNEPAVPFVYAAAPANIITTTALVQNVGGIGSVTVPAVSIPANTTCNTQTYFFYAYISDLTTAGPGNSPLPADCEPVIYTQITVFPDPADLTPVVIGTEDCVSFFGILDCPDFEVNPAFYAANEGDAATTQNVSVLSGTSNPCADAAAVPVNVPACDSECPEIYDIQLEAESICEVNGVNITVVTEDLLIGKDLTIAYGNPGQAVIADPYSTAPPNVITTTATVDIAAGNGVVAVDSGNFPANDSCSPETYVIYVYVSDLTTAGAGNSALPADCKPIAYSSVTVWPDPADMTVGIEFTEDCLTIFEVLDCPSYQPSPKFYISPDGSDATDVDVAILADPASPCADSDVTALTVPACVADCPDITDIQLNEEIICENGSTQITVTTDSELVGETLTFAYGTANEGVLTDVYTTAPSTIISTNVLVTDNSGTAIATLASGQLPANNTCEPETYIVYAYLTDPSTAGPLDSALPDNCRPVVYTNFTIYPDLTDVTINTTVENCIATFTPVCPNGSSSGVTVTPSSYVIPTATNPGAGIPTLTISGGVSSPCSDVSITNIDLPYCEPDCAIFISVENTDPTDCGVADGTIIVNANGGLPPYNYSIDGGTTYQTSNTFTSLSGGTYDVVVQNADLSCEVTFPNVVLEDKIAPIITSVTPTDISDCNETNGTITILANATQSVEYSIDGGTSYQSSNYFDNLAAGTYNITVRNIDGTCATNFDGTITITAPTAPSVSGVLSINPLDCGVNDGTITINGTAGSETIEYSIDGGFTWQTVNEFTALGAGTYYVFVRNNTGTCVTPYTLNPVILTAPDAPVITNVAFTDPSECGFVDGTITVTAIGGIAPLEYSIDGGATWQGGNTFTGLSGGNYPIQVRNSLGSSCVVTGSVVILEDKVAPVITTVSATDITDCNETDGTISIFATANESVEYSIDGGTTYQSSNYFDNLMAGTYQIRVRNVDGTCVVSDENVIITAPTAPSYTFTQITNTTDCGVNDGALTITASGTGAIEYSINGGFTWLTTNSFTNLPAGTYDILIRNEDDTCEVFGETVTITAPDAPVITNVAFTDPTECDVADGTITITAAGTGGTLEYSIDNGTNWFANGGNFSSLAASGNPYQILVRYIDDSCPVTGSIVVLEDKIAPIIVSVSSSNVSDCGVTDGNITIISSASQSVQYSIDGGVSWQSSNYFDNLPAGTYQIRVRNVDGTCEVLAPNEIITAPIAPVVLGPLVSNPSNCGMNDGSIQINAIAGSGSYEYSINGGFTWQTADTFSNLGPGNYNVTVRNDDGTCEVPFGTVTLTAPDAATITNVSFTEPTECGVNDGTITITASGNVTLEYSIDGGTTWIANDGTFINLAGGTYQIMVRNIDDTCEVMGEIVVLTDKVQPVIIDAVKTNVTDCGADDGTITIYVDATQSIEYSIDGGTTWQSSNYFDNLASGAYQVLVRNIDGTCATTQQNVIITEPVQPVINSVVTNDPTDCGEVDGQITVTATFNPLTGIEYSIDGGLTWQTANTFPSLPAGTYNIAIRNADGTCLVQNLTATILDDDCGPIDDCPDVNSILAMQPDICSEGNANFILNTDESLNGELMNYVLINPASNVNPYTQTETGTTQVNGNVANFDIDMPANTTCDVITVEVYAYLNAATIANLGLDTDCRPFVATTVNIWPDITQMTPQVSATNGCAIALNSDCDGYVTTPNLIIQESGQTGSAFQAITINAPAGSPCGDFETTIDLSAQFCEPGCELFCPGSTNRCVDAEDCIWTADATVNPVITDCNDVSLTYVVVGPMGAVTTGSDSLIDFEFELGASAVTWIMTDNVNPNITTQCSFTVSITDCEAPSITTCPADATTEACDANDLQAWIDTFAGTDNCDDDLAVTYVLIAQDDLCANTFTATYEFTLTDDAGNVTSCTATYSTFDNVAPEITVPTPLILSCGDDVLLMVETWANQVSTGDDCGMISQVTNTIDYTALQNIDYCTAQNFEVLFTAFDECGNTNALSTNIIIEEDTTPPVFTNCPADMVVGVDVSACTANINFSIPIAEDCSSNTQGNVTMTQTQGLAPGQIFPFGETLIEYTATDACGNTTTCSFMITVVDTDSPQILCPTADIIVCAEQDQCVWIGDQQLQPISFFENCPNFVVFHEITGATEQTGTGTAVGENLNIGFNTITYNILDGAGDEFASCSFNVIVEDCQAPTITCSDETVACGDENIMSWAMGIAATASDLCNDVSVEYRLYNDLPACDFTINQVYEFVATDSAGNETVCYATYTSTDSIKPNLEAPADLQLACGDDMVGLTLDWLETYTASDACGDFSVSDNFNFNTLGTPCNGVTIPVSFTAVDVCGNDSTMVANIVIAPDTTNPTFVNCPSNMVVNADADICEANVIYSTPIAEDCNSVAVTFTSGIPSGQAFPLGTTPIVFTATDVCGNTETCEFTITVLDSQNPEIVCPSSVNVCNDASACFWTANTAADPVFADCNTTNLSYSIQNPDGTTNTGTGFISASAYQFALGNSIVTYTITDSANANNTASCNFTVSVENCTEGYFDIPSSWCQDDPIFDFELGTNLFISPNSANISIASVPAGFVTGSETAWQFNPAGGILDNATDGFASVTITLTVENGDACTISYSQEVTVNQTGNANFVLPTSVCEANGTVALNLDTNINDGAGAETMIAEYVTWSGPAVTENEDGISAIFNPATYGEGFYEICATVGAPSCEETVCHTIIVENETIADIFDITQCADPSGLFSLIDIIAPNSSLGGTFSVANFVNGGAVTIAGTNMTYNYTNAVYPIIVEIQYGFDNNNDGDFDDVCESVDTAIITIIEQPNPSFDLPSSFCELDEFGNNITYDLTAYLTSETYSVSSIYTFGWEIISGNATISADGTIFDPTGTGLVTIQLTDTIAENNLNCIAQWQEIVSIEAFPCLGACGEAEDIDIQDNIICANEELVLNVIADDNVIYPDNDGNMLGDYYLDFETNAGFDPYNDTPNNRIVWGDNVPDGSNLGTLFYGENSLSGLAGLGIESNTVYYIFGSVWEDNGNAPVEECQDYTSSSPFVLLDPLTVSATDCMCNNNETDQFDGTHSITITPDGGAPVAFNALGLVMANTLGIGESYTWSGIGTIPSSGTANNGETFDVTVFDGQAWAITLRDNNGCERTISGNCQLPQPDLIGLTDNCTSDPIYTIFDDRVFDANFYSDTEINQAVDFLGIDTWPGLPIFNSQAYHYQFGPFDSNNTPLLNDEFAFEIEFDNIISNCPNTANEFLVTIYVNGNSYVDFYPIQATVIPNTAYIIDENSTQVFGNEIDPITSSDIVDIYILSGVTTCDAGDAEAGWLSDISVNFEATFASFTEVSYEIQELDINGNPIAAPAGLLTYNGDGSAIINPGMAGDGGQFLITYCELNNPSENCEICIEELINIYPTLSPVFSVIPSICVDAPPIPLVPLNLGNYAFPDVFTAQPTGNNLNDYTGWSGPGVVDNGNGTGLFIPADLAPGVYTINFFSGYDDCKEYYSQTVEVYDIPNATINDFKVCEADGTFNLTQLFTGGVTTTGGYFTASEGTVNGNILILDDLGCAGLDAAPITITYTVGNANIGCEGVGTAEITVCPNVNAAFTIPPAVCVDPANVSIPVSLSPDNVPPSCTLAEEAVWSLTYLNLFTGQQIPVAGITQLDNFEAEFDALVATEGLNLPATFFITFELGNDDCRESFTKTITVVDELVANLGFNLTTCYSPSGIDLTGFLGFNTTPGGTWSIIASTNNELLTVPNGLFGNTFTPPFSTTGECYTIQYMVEDSRGLCNSDSDEVEICFTPTPGTMLDLPSAFCAVNNQGDGMESDNIVNLANYITSNSNNTIQVDSVAWEIVEPAIFADTIYTGTPSNEVYLDASSLFGLITIRYTEVSSFNGVDCEVSYDEIIEIYPDVNPTFICPQTICIDEFNELNPLVLYPEIPLANLGYNFAESDTSACSDPFFEYLDDNVVWSISAVDVNGNPFATNSLQNIFDCADTLNNQSAIFSLPEQAGVYTVTLTMGKGDCKESFSCEMVISDSQLTEVFTVENDTVCISDIAIDLNLYLPSNLANSGTFTGSGVVGTQFYTSDAGVGAHTICYESNTGFGTCDGSQDCMTILVEGEVDASWMPESFYCENEIIHLLPNTPDANGYWTANDSFINSLIEIDPTAVGGAFIDSPIELAEYSPFEITYNVVSEFGTCMASEMHIVNVGNQVSAALVEDVTLCYEDDFDLTGFFAEGTSNGGYFIGQNVFGNELIPSSNGGTYTITYTVGDLNSACGIDTDQITITIISAPNADFDLPGAFCELQFQEFYFLPEFLLPDATIGGVWSIVEGGGNINGENYSPNGYSGTTTIRYTVGEGECSTYHDEVVVVGNSIDASFSLPLAICVGETYSLDGFAVTTGYPWSGVGVNNGVFAPAAEGTYTITHTVGTGLCEDSFSVTVEVEDVPSAPNVPSSYVACSTDLIEIMVTSDYDHTFNLYNGNGDLLETGTAFLQDSFDVSAYINEAGTYTFRIEAINELGCAGDFANVIYVVLEQPIISNIEVACTDISTALSTVSVNAANTGQFAISYDGGISFGNFGDTTVDLMAGSYQVLIQDENGCTSSVIPLEVNNPLDFEVLKTCTGPDGTAEIEILPSGGNGNYTIILNGDIVSGLAHTVNQGTVEIILLDGENCATTTRVIEIDETLTFDTYVGCPDSEGIVEVQVLYAGAQNQTVFVNGMMFTNPFFVNINDYDELEISIAIEGCVGSSSLVNIANQLYAGVETVGCFDGNANYAPVSLYALGGNGNYTVSINNSIPQVYGEGFFYLEAGTYTFEVFDESGCSSGLFFTEIEEDIVNTPSLASNSVATACEASEIILFAEGANSDGQAYTWLDEDGNIIFVGNGFTPAISENGTYIFYVQIQTEEGCLGNDLAFVVELGGVGCGGGTDCINPPVCEITDVCVLPMTQTILCPENCDVAGMSITGSASIYNCAIDEMPNGCVLYTPLPGMEMLGGDYVIVNYSDGENCLDVYYTIAIQADCTENVPPVAEDDEEISDENGVYISVLDNDSDADGDSITICEVSEPSNGMVFIQGNELYYVPNTGFYGTDTFDYTICDVNGGEATATVTVIVPEPTAPCATEVAEYCIGEMGVQYLCPEFCGEENFVINDIVSIYHCSIFQISETCVRYIALPGFFGDDLVVVSATNDAGETFTAEYYITVSDNCEGENTPPIALADNAATYANILVEIPALANDSDVDNGDAINICSYSNPNNGAIVEENGVFTFYPSLDFVGTVSFEYTVCDNFGGEATTTVTIDVLPYDCENEELNLCTKPMTQLVICPEFCHFDEDFTIYNVYEIFDVESLYGCAYEIISPTCITYRPLPGLSGIDIITILAQNEQGEISAVQVNIDISNLCENGARFGEEDALLPTGCDLQAPDLFLTNETNIVFDTNNCYQETTYTLEVFNINGQLVNTTKGGFSDSEITEKLKDTLLGNTGYYIYRLTLDNEAKQQISGSIIVGQ